MASCMATSSRASASVTRAGARAVPTLAVRTHRRTSVVVRAEAAGPRVQPPAGVTLPTQEPKVPPPTFGFVHFAEKINSRACMLGFFALLAVEAISGRGLLEMLGLTIGKGLPFSL